MNTNFQITLQTFKSLHEQIQPIQRTSLFTKLFKSKDNKIIKRRVFETKKEWLTWKEKITQELLNQRILSSKYPGKVLTILNYTVETINHQRNLFVAYDCEDDIEPLFQYLNNNTVSFQEQAQIFEQLLQIACILFKAQFEHTNLKPNNILYYKKQVLITDFGSARTHYQNFLKEYTGQAEKEWQNNLIFFYPEEYQKIMEEENFYFRVSSWNEFDVSDQKFRKYIDIWALSMMMIQVFENNQTLPKNLSDYYGLNNKQLFQKIENLKQYQNGIFSEVIFTLLIQKKDPELVYQTFLQQKKLNQTESQSQMESTFTIKQIFDHADEDENTYRSFKPQNYFLANQAIQELQDQFDDDDSSSVISSNYQIDILGFTEIKQRNNLTQIPNQIPQRQNQQSPTRIKPESQQYDFSLNPLQFFQIQDNPQNLNNVTQIKPSLAVVNYEFNQQQFEGVQVEDTKTQNDHIILVPMQSQLQVLTDRNDKGTPINLEQVQDVIQIGQTQGGKSKNDNQQLGCLQIIQLDKIDDNKQGETSNNFISMFNQTQNFQFLEDQKIVQVNQNNSNMSEIVTYIDNQNFQFNNSNNYDLLNLNDEEKPIGQLNSFQGQKEIQDKVKQINILAIDDFESEDQQVPKENQVQKQIIQSGQQEFNLLELKDSKTEIQTQQQNSQQTNLLIIIPSKQKLIPQTDDPNQSKNGIQSQVEKSNISIMKNSLQVLQPFNDENYEANQIDDGSVIIVQNQQQDDYSLLIDITENNQQQFPDKKKTNRQNNQEIINKDNSFQQIQQFEDPKETIDQESQENPVSLKIIKNQLNEGVIQLKDKDQNEILKQLKLIKRIFNHLEQHPNDPTNIFEDEQGKKNQKQIQQLFDEIVIQKEKEQLQLIDDVNDGLDVIQKKQEADHFFDDNNIQNYPHLLTYLNEDQLNVLKSEIQSNKFVTDLIQKLIEVKEDLKKLKQNPILQNILKKQQVELLNKEELKIYLRLLDKVPKDRKQGDRLIASQSAVENKLKEIKLKEQEELNKQKIIEFLRNPSFDNLLPDALIRKLRAEERKKYKAALKDLKLKSTQRQKKIIQEQIDIINEIKRKHDRNKIQINKIDEVSNEGSTKQSSKNTNYLTFQAAYLKAIKQLVDDKDSELLSQNKYIREFQLIQDAYQITDLVPSYCYNFSQQFKNRKLQFYDFQGSKYKGETLDDYPDGMGILRKRGVSSIYKGFFKKGKFYWGQVLEMNDKGLLTQYVGYYNQEFEVKHGKARLKWFKPYREKLFLEAYKFNVYEIYEGDFIMGYIHGQGKKVYADQSEYEGEWKKNQRVGFGRLIIRQGGQKSITYEGEFQDNVQHGKNVKAIHHHQTGLDLIVEGEYKKGKPIGSHLLIFNQIQQKVIHY
ncbi:unnamed protein product (macronuclear) [Paramecium tetraurelia]|uniref:MORN repeat-containing protein 3 n=1 Tax=Paramecium tetraurelia TaxID=5888 RepID=A0C0W9_PARTE|nr:uncharacterized protein GSPATT00033912001 [Paramecium tetraurelia]CAK64436.1 unnamed protein product [Paramecium tetraurelia]|eukprot:XP_001431834.1 hypothetical protein (macronuclear) [Paramecium tetraurelia strain d4-2]